MKTSTGMILGTLRPAHHEKCVGLGMAQALRRGDSRHSTLHTFPPSLQPALRGSKVDRFTFSSYQGMRGSLGRVIEERIMRDHLQKCKIKGKRQDCTLWSAISELEKTADIVPAIPRSVLDEGGSSSSGIVTSCTEETKWWSQVSFFSADPTAQSPAIQKKSILESELNGMFFLPLG